MRNIKDSRRHFSKWREETREDYGFYSGEQWSEEDKALLQNQMRPAVVFNRTARIINTVGGLEVQNRQEVRFIPRKAGDATNSGEADLWSDASKWVRETCDAEDEESEAFTDAAICGQGWTETRIDYETDSEGMILIERRDPLEMGVDHTSKKRNFDDSRFRYRIKPYSKSEYQERFPGKDIPESRFFDSDDKDMLKEDRTPGGYGERSNVNTNTDTRDIQVCHYQYYKIEHVRPVVDGTGQMTEMPEARFKAMKEQIDASGWKYTSTPRPKRVYKQCFLTPEEILSEEDAPVNGFSFNAITGLRDRNNNIWFGFIRLMKDPQRWANKWLSQIQHILNTQAKSGKVAFETGTFKDPKKAKNEWAKVDGMLEVNAGKLDKFMQLNMAQFPEGIDRLLQYAMSAINDTPGINMELMGLANRDQPGVLEESRKKAGVTILAVLFDSLRRYRKEQGRILAEFIRTYIADGRLIRISGDWSKQFVPLIRDRLSIKYDIVIDDAPTSPNMKEKTFSTLATILPGLLQTGIPIPPDLLDYAPLPSELVYKWKKYIADSQNNPDKAQAKALQQGQAQADIMETQSQAELNKAKAAEIMGQDGSGQMEVMKLQQDGRFQQQKLAQEGRHQDKKMMVDASLHHENNVMQSQVNLAGKKIQAHSQLMGKVATAIFNQPKENV